MFLSWDYLIRIKDQIYSDMKLAMMDDIPKEVKTTNEIISDIPVVENVTDPGTGTDRTQSLQGNIIADDQRIGDIVEFRKDHRDENRPGKAENQSRDIAFRQ